MLFARYLLDLERMRENLFRMKGLPPKGVGAFNTPLQILTHLLLKFQKKIQNCEMLAKNWSSNGGEDRYG